MDTAFRDLSNEIKPARPSPPSCPAAAPQQVRSRPWRPCPYKNTAKLLKAAEVFQKRGIRRANLPSKVRGRAPPAVGLQRSASPRLVCMQRCSGPACRQRQQNRPPLSPRPRPSVADPCEGGSRVPAAPRWTLKGPPCQRPPPSPTPPASHSQPHTSYSTLPCFASQAQQATRGGTCMWGGHLGGEQQP